MQVLFTSKLSVIVKQKTRLWQNLMTPNMMKKSKDIPLLHFLIWFMSKLLGQEDLAKLCW